MVKILAFARNNHQNHVQFVVKVLVFALKNHHHLVTNVVRVLAYVRRKQKLNWLVAKKEKSNTWFQLRFGVLMANQFQPKNF